MKPQEIARQTLEKSMNVVKGEEVVIVADTPQEKIGRWFLEGALELGAEASFVLFSPRSNNGEEPPAAVAGAMQAGDVLMLITSKSLSHTAARREASKRGARAASMPMLTEEMMMRALAVDYNKIKESCDRFSAILTEAKEVHLTTPAGTDLSFSIAGRKGFSDSGIYHNRGDFGNLPAGEASVAPVEGSASGVLVVDASMAGVGLLEKPLKIEIEKGLATRITGGESADKLIKILERYGEKARNIAELGIGLNPAAKITGFVLEDEKMEGTCHIALGDNSSFGGNVAVNSHLDGVVLNPTLVIDGKKLIEDGKIKI